MKKLNLKRLINYNVQRVYKKFFNKNFTLRKKI